MLSKKQRVRRLYAVFYNTKTGLNGYKFECEIICYAIVDLLK